MRCNDLRILTATREIRKFLCRLIVVVIVPDVLNWKPLLKAFEIFPHHTIPEAQRGSGTA